MFNNLKVKYKHYPSELVYLIKRNKDMYVSPISVKKGNTKFIAHRGLSGIKRENTVSSFTEAGKLWYYGIETDVHRTKDGSYVIIHDDNTKRVSGVDKVVENSTLEELKSVKLYAKNGDDSLDGTTIPMLTDYVNICKKCEKIGVLELKNHFEEQDIKNIIAIIKESDYLNNITFISFDLENCITVRKLLPKAKVQYLSCQYDDGLIDTLKKEKLDLDIYYRELNKKRIDLLHANGIEVNCWTVDSIRYANKLIKWGVEYITTNILIGE